MLIKLNRFKMHEDGTLSAVEVYDEQGKVADFWGIEKAWRNNAAFVSCIPAGFYKLEPFRSSNHGQTWAICGGTVAPLEGDAERFACLFHVANYGAQVEGCIGLGTGVGETAEGKLAVWSSRIAMGNFLNLLSVEQENTLKISWFEPQ